MNDRSGREAAEPLAAVHLGRTTRDAEATTMADPYDRDWDPRAYLQQYYAAGVMAADERVNAVHLVQWLRGAGRRFARALEFGCGPTVHHAAILAPYVDQLDLSDYVPANLTEVRKWLDGAPDAHDWDGQLGDLLATEQTVGAPAESLESRKARLRKVVRDLRIGDCRRPVALGERHQYDLVATFYTIESVDEGKHAWERHVGNVCELVRPGGVFTCATARRADHYRVLDRAYSTTSIDEDDYLRVLPTLGFDPKSMHALGVPVGHWAAQGFSGICLVWATKTGG
jgi:SAM-dependent methyltransferase